MDPYSWTCPFCNHDTTITDKDSKRSSSELTILNKEGDRILFVFWTVCPNNKCKRFTLSVGLYEYVFVERACKYTIGKSIQSWNLVPFSIAKIFPDYVPEAIRNDYKEACSIKDLSHSCPNYD